MVRSGYGWRRGHIGCCEKGFEMSARESERGEMVGLGEMRTEAEIRCNLLKVGYLPFI